MLRHGVTSYALDQELVLFSEETQLLVGLNPSAARIVTALQQGASPADVTQSLKSAGMASNEAARDWVAATLDGLKSHGLLQGAEIECRPRVSGDDPSGGRAADVKPYEPFTPAVERYYRLLGSEFLVRFSHQAQRRMVDSVIGHLAVAGGDGPVTVIEIAATPWGGDQLCSEIYRDGQPHDFAPRLSLLGPIVKALIWQIAVNAYDFLFYLHAGVVGTGEGCIVLPAQAGSGKSSLTAALVHHGYQYYSDEVALIDRTSFRVPPVPLAISVKDTGWDLMARYFPDLAKRPVHRRRDRKILRYIPPPPGSALPPPARVTHMIFPRYVPGAKNDLRPLPRAEALGRAMGECLAVSCRLDQTIVGEIVRWIAAIDCYSLEFSSLDEAVRLVARIRAPSNGPNCRIL